MILHGLCPAALIRQPRFFCAIFIADLHGIATRALSVSVFSFFGEFRIKKPPGGGGWSMQKISYFYCSKTGASGVSQSTPYCMDTVVSRQTDS